MKPIFDKKKLHHFIMIMCFIYGGISIVIFISQLYFLVRRGQFDSSFGRIAYNLTSNNLTHLGFWTARRTSMFYPVVIISFLGSIVSILAGLSLFDLLRKKERKELTKSVIDSMTTPEEKAVIRELETNNGELTQSELVKRTKLSKVKVHRIIKRLESLKVVSKYPYGVTNKIKLEKKIYEE
jgi:Fic family protein